MFTQLFKKTFFSKIISFIVAVSFIFTIVPVGNASVFISNSLKTPAAKDRVTEELTSDLGATVKSQKIDPLVLSNTISLLEGAQTGGSNIEHALVDGANGGIFNHSERRRRLEIAMENMLIGIQGLRRQGILEEKILEETIKEIWRNTLKTENLSDKEINATLEWLSDFQNDKWDIERLSRRIVNYIMNIQLKKIITYSDKYHITQTVLCVGETRAQYDAKRTQEVLKQDLEEILAGITLEQAWKIGLRIAYESRWAINQTPPVTPDPEKEIQPTHRYIKNTLRGIIGAELAADYGGSLNEKNCQAILSLPDVDGGLIGGAAKVPEKISVIIDAGIEQGQKKGKLLNIGMNWKAEDASTGLSPLDAFVELFRTKDLSKVTIAIGTPNVKLVRDTMTKLEDEISAIALYSGVVVKTETVGSFTKETLAAKSQATESIYGELEKRFGEKTKEGDVYLRLKIGNKYFALAKENRIDQTLMTATTLDLTDRKTKTEYYAALLEYVSLVTTQTNTGIELIEEKGDRLEGYLSLAANPTVTQEAVSLGNIRGSKFWYGQDKFFQMEYKPVSADSKSRPTLITFRESDRPISRGRSLIVQPKYTQLIFGFGTIGSQIAEHSRKLGYNVLAVNRSANEKAGFAQNLGIPLYLLTPEDKKAFEKAKIETKGTLEDLLKSGAVDLIADATDGETTDPATGEEITVAAYNKKYIYSKYPNIKVTYEGAEDPGIADKYFDVGLLTQLGIPFSRIMDGVKSLFFPSCNTTGQGLILDRVASHATDLQVRISTHRRINDPGQKGKLSPDGTVSESGYHHADDYLAGRKHFPQILDAFRKGPTGAPMLTTDASTTHLTKFHIVEMWITGLEKNTNKPLTAESVKRALSSEQRLALVDFKKNKFDSTELINILQKLKVVHPYTPVVQVLDLPNGDVKVVMAVPQESVIIPNVMSGVDASSGFYRREASVRRVNGVMGLPRISGAIENMLPLKSARVSLVKTVEPKASVAVAPCAFSEGKWKTSIPILDAYKGKLQGKKVYLRTDLNVLNDLGEFESMTRFESIIKVCYFVINEGGTPVVVTHVRRPKGKVIKLLSVEKVAAKFDELAREMGYNINVKFHPESVTEKGLKPGLKNEIVTGAVNFLENIRFTKKEEDREQTFAKELAGLVDNYLGVFCGFGSGAVVGVSTMDVFQYMDNIAVDSSIEDELNNIAHIRENLNMLIFGGGPKIDDKIPLLEGIFGNFKNGGVLALGSAPSLVFWKAKGWDIHSAKPIEEKTVEAARRILNKAESLGIRLLLAVDFKVAVGVDVAKEGKIPEGVKTYQLTVEQLSQPFFTDPETNEKIPTNTLDVYDLGDKSISQDIEAIRRIPKDLSVFWNGNTGVDLVEESSLKIAQALDGAKEQNGVDSMMAGGTTSELASRVNPHLNNKIKSSQGGGSALTAMQDGSLPVTSYLESIQAGIEIAKRINARPTELRDFINADGHIYRAQGGDLFSEYVDKLLPYLLLGKKQVVQQRVSGALENCELSAEPILDSRGKSTVRVRLKIGNTETTGEVPAGASKGGGEAIAVSTEQAIKNIQEIIAPLLRNSGYNLTKYVDLRRAETLIIAKAGENFKDLGTNAVVPVSWALWKMAAKINNVELEDYIREYEPGAISNESVNFFMNIYNGGLHALKENEKLSENRIDVQEIMIVPVGAKNYSQALEMGDKVDRELKKILEGKFDKAKVSRADEAGFSVNGLGNSSEAIGYVLQAIQNAGYEPGKDIKLALDVAATTFYKEKEKPYDFQGQQLTAKGMIKYYIDLVEKYPGKIISIEDGLAENDWEGWIRLTAEMSKRGVLTIGDDLFVTQMARLKRGIESKATSAILIKVNQNGTVGGTLDVIEEALKNRLKIVVSHRSGETLDDSIARLAFATGATGLQSGDPQPRVDFPYDAELVRRNKYLRMVAIQGERALVLGPNFLKTGGVKNALNKVAELSKVMRIALYGEKAEDLKILLENKDIITGKSLDEVLVGLSNLGISAENILLLRAPDDKLDSSIAEKMEKQKVRQIVAGEISTVALAKALEELFTKEGVPGGDAAVSSAFAVFLDDIKYAGVISEEAYQRTYVAVLAKLEEGKVFEFPEELKPTLEITAKIQAESDICKQVLTRIGV